MDTGALCLAHLWGGPNHDALPEGAFSTKFLLDPPNGWQVDWSRYNTHGPAGLCIKRDDSRIWQLTGERDNEGLWLGRWPD